MPALTNASRASVQIGEQFGAWLNVIREPHRYVTRHRLGRTLVGFEFVSAAEVGEITLGRLDVAEAVVATFMGRVVTRPTEDHAILDAA